MSFAHNSRRAQASGWICGRRSAARDRDIDPGLGRDAVRRRPRPRADRGGDRSLQRGVQAGGRQRRARFVDITAISRKSMDDISLVADDGLHPSPKMYRQWVDVVLTEAKVALNLAGDTI